MTRITFSDKQQYDFARQFLLRPKGVVLFDASLNPIDLSIDIPNSYIARLFQRLSTNYPIVLPFRRNEIDNWFVTAKDPYQLDRALAQVSRLLVPSYAEYAGGGSPQHQRFDESKTRLQQIGAQLYPAGYYVLDSSPSQHGTILKRLELWLRLVSQQPRAHLEPQHTYRDLYYRFNLELTSQNWADAESSLAEMRRRNLSTADNLQFLRVQFLASQGRWRELWESPDYFNIARLRMPRSVRGDLLTAFHSTLLLPLEQQGLWNEALTAFANHRARLGELLTTRAGLTEWPVLNVFAYQAGYVNDHASLDAVRSVAVAPETLRCIDALEQILPARQPVQPTTSPELRARLALDNSDYDAALQAAEEISLSLQQIRYLLIIAAETLDPVLADRALLLFYGLSDVESAELLRMQRYMQLYVSDLEALLSGPEPPSSETEGDLIAARNIGTWAEWFEAVAEKPDDKRLLSAIDRLQVVTDERFWTTESIAELNEQIQRVGLDANLAGRPIVKQAIGSVVNVLLQEKAFPRSDAMYAEVYETLYTVLLESTHPGLDTFPTLLRLAEALLRCDASHKSVEAIFNNLHNWAPDPIPALEPHILDTFDLLADYELQSGLLQPWYREWVEKLLESPTERDRTYLETWLIFGSWIKVDYYLTNRLTALTEASINQGEDDPIAQLPEGYRIAIFTLRPASATRAASILNQRNPKLNVQICSETDLNGQAKALAQNSEMSVVVTTCLTHSLFYGIDSFINDAPVYPISSGTSSIVKAIEGRARSLSTQLL